ncbi:MAG TPA: hypothetical protein PK252_11475 [Bacteroidales bacterium]|nr:hypothetical protein [Bacteroidales bacterium]
MTYDKKIILFSVNSFFAFLSSFLLLHILSQIVTIIVAHANSIPTRFNYFNVIFPISDDSNLWTQNSVVSIYLSGPLFCLLLGLAFRRYLTISIDNPNRNTKLFFIWGYTHAMNCFFGGLIAGIPLLKGIGYVPIWLYFSNTALIITIVFSGVLLLLNGFFLRNIFSSLSYAEICWKKPFLFKFMIIYAPYLLAFALFFILRFPDNSIYQQALMVTLLLQLFFIMSNSYIHEWDDEVKVSIAVSWKLILLCLSLFWIIFIWSKM